MKFNGTLDSLGHQLTICFVRPIKQWYGRNLSEQSNRGHIGIGVSSNHYGSSLTLPLEQTRCDGSRVEDNTPKRMHIAVVIQKSRDSLSVKLALNRRIGMAYPSLNA